MSSSSNASLSGDGEKSDNRLFRLANRWQGIKIESALVASGLRLRSSNLGLSLL
ncbi:MAG: hypothetical protein VKK42_02855 [Lyngbya sp.]|nr:hypothetical protein [Lyngbya sp.]